MRIPYIGDHVGTSVYATSYILWQAKPLERVFVAMTFEVCSICGKHGRVGLGDGVNYLNTGSKEHAIHITKNAGIHAHPSNEDIVRIIKEILESSLPSWKEVTDAMLWNLDVHNGKFITPHPDLLCSVLEQFPSRPIPSDFRQKVEEFHNRAEAN